MTKHELINRFLCVSFFGEEEHEAVYWLADKESTQDDVLKLQAYDCNLCGLPDMSKWNSKSWRNKNIEFVREATKDYDIEVWMDDMKVKNKGEKL